LLWPDYLCPVQFPNSGNWYSPDSRTQPPALMTATPWVTTGNRSRGRDIRVDRIQIFGESPLIWIFLRARLEPVPAHSPGALSCTATAIQCRRPDGRAAMSQISVRRGGLMFPTSL